MKSVVWRAHHPAWAWDPLSGDGAKATGGRFNPIGMPALYTATSELTALAEAQQGFAVKAQPMTLVAYHVDCADILDLTEPAVRRAHGVTEADLACAWGLLLAEGKPVPSHELARRLAADGAAGIIVPSFAPGAPADGTNVVFWRWSRKLPHQVVPIDDHGRLPHRP